jgi:hypothetical protein
MLKRMVRTATILAMVFPTCPRFTFSFLVDTRRLVSNGSSSGGAWSACTPILASRWFCSLSSLLIVLGAALPDTLVSCWDGVLVSCCNDCMAAYALRQVECFVAPRPRVL